MSKLIFANLAKTALTSGLRAQKKFARNLAKIKSLPKPRQNKLANLATKTLRKATQKHDQVSNEGIGKTQKAKERIFIS
tara:strand:- start:57 stop:293 length:237 start_codon:yes stop_codon:yes gene_type:complete